jgi:hypothetical protein
MQALRNNDSPLPGHNWRREAPAWSEHPKPSTSLLRACRAYNYCVGLSRRVGKSTPTGAMRDRISVRQNDGDPKED